MTEATCRRELDLEIPAEEVQKAMERVAREFARVARVPGFRPGKAPVTLIRRRFADGDYAQIELVGTPVGGGEPLRGENVLCHIGAEETLGAFSENLRGAQTGDHRRFEVRYPEDFPDPKLAGKVYTYAIEIVANKEKKLPELNDEFAKDVSEAATLEELRGKIRQNLEAERDLRRTHQAHDRIVSKLIAAHDFPVPEALIEQQMDVRLERAIRSLAAQGVDPRSVNVDWVTLRRRQRDRALEDVKAELILDRIASAEGIEADEQEVQRQIALLAERSGESATAVQARLTKQGALDRIKSKLRSDKTLEWLYKKTRIRTKSE